VMRAAANNRAIDGTAAAAAGATDAGSWLGELAYARLSTSCRLHTVDEVHRYGSVCAFIMSRYQFRHQSAATGVLREAMKVFPPQIVM